MARIALIVEPTATPSSVMLTLDMVTIASRLPIGLNFEASALEA